MNITDFYRGQEFEAYQYLGAHVMKKGVVFRAYAPAALKVDVIGEFNSWTETPMYRVHDGNFFEAFIEDAKPDQMYKYRIYHQSGRFIDHCDPYGFSAEVRPGNASIIFDLGRYRFHDQKWVNNRKNYKGMPINIYEMHFGSWKKKIDTTDPEGWYRYEELGDLLIPYLQEYGYNYVELMPLNEYPSDESWGYQATGFFAPTARYGNPDGLRSFVDQCHQNGIGVIMDFVPVHFAVNDYALWNYDGTPLYEHSSADVGYSEWGSCNFMHSRGDVCSFLSSAAYYWLKEYHIDGLRMDAVGNLIYWMGNKDRGENLSALQFLRDMNEGLRKRQNEVLLFAEDSSSWQGVTRDVKENGLGFDYKWDLGWMNDTLDFFAAPPAQRPSLYHRLTFSMYYYYNEHFLLPLSHDEVVHGKKTIVDKMYGSYEEKFAQARALYMYMYAHPGKKLNFMGNELGQLREWDEKRSQDWLLLDYPMHTMFHRFMRDLNHVYLYHPSLSQYDYENKGFRWIDCHQESRCLYIMERSSDHEKIVAMFNFSDKPQVYLLKVDHPVAYKALMSSDTNFYGGQAMQDEKLTVVMKSHAFALAPYSAVYYLEVDADIELEG